MKVYYCQKEFDNAIEYLASMHTLSDMKSKKNLSVILKRLIAKADDHVRAVSSAGFTVQFTEEEDDDMYATITVTPYLSYQDELEEFPTMTYLEV